MGKLLCFLTYESTPLAPGMPSQCWESYIGNQVYSLFTVLFLAELISTLSVDPIKGFCYRRWKFAQVCWYARGCPCRSLPECPGSLVPETHCSPHPACLPLCKI
jgi:hypothetical protein